VHGLRTVDFAWLVEELRSTMGKSASVLAKILWSHDEGGMDMLQADDLDEAEFKLFAEAMREICDASAAVDPRSGMSQFLTMLLHQIEADSRYS